MTETLGKTTIYSQLKSCATFLVLDTVSKQITFSSEATQTHPSNWAIVKAIILLKSFATYSFDYIWNTAFT